MALVGWVGAVLVAPGVAYVLGVRGRAIRWRAEVEFTVFPDSPSPSVVALPAPHRVALAIPPALPLADRLERTSPDGVDLWIVPVLNPDGRAAGTRGNAHGVDLNRNFPWRWRRMRGFYESGPHPLSEPEARIAYRLILRLRPHVSIWFHQHLDLVWASGGDRRIERRFARLSGLRYHPLPPLAGSTISWQNHALPGTTAFAAELPAGELSSSAAARYARAVIAVGHR
jgi:protein MpaA